MAKSLTQEEFDIKHANEVELAKRELTRAALDTIRIYNPLDETFVYMYDRYWHRVPAKSAKEVDRYLAKHFFKKICDKIIGDQIMQKGTELKAFREKQMGQPFLDHYEENVQVWDKVPKMDDPELIKEIKKIVILGVVEEYGMDEPELQEEERVEETPFDLRAVHEQVFDDIERLTSPPTPERPVIKPVDEPLTAKSKKDLEKEITNE